MISAARGAAPQVTRSALRGGTLGNMSASSAKAAARTRLASSGITSAEKALGKQFLAGRVSWVPTKGDWAAAFKRPWREIKLPDVRLPEEILNLPKVSSAMRQMHLAIRT